VVLPTLGADGKTSPLLCHVDSAGSTTTGLVVDTHHALRAGVDVIDGRGDDVGRASDGLARRLIDVDRCVFLLFRRADNARGRAASQDGKNNQQNKTDDRFHDNLLIKMNGIRSSQ
jgi:hypothetical protein